jgi:ribonucleoside-diphosphate reductase alpha chain
MLDNVIDINYYPTAEARQANIKHRPVGLGLMGFQDALQLLNIPYGSEAAVAFSDHSMEIISYHAISASAKLAKEKGTYASYSGSLWDQGIFPLDTLDRLEKERGIKLEIDRHAVKDWSPVKTLVKQYGMRNSQVLAIAPTAAISQIAGVSQSIEPLYSTLFVKSNLSGDFTYVNELLVEELKQINLWNQEMLDELKYEDGSIQQIERIPAHIREKYKTSFEIGAEWLIRCAAKRQKWIDMGQSLNLYLADPSGKKLDEMYQLAWQSGLKTTYYLRTRAATQVEKSTLDINRFGIQPKWMKNKSASSDIELKRSCSLQDPTCEACQ